MTKPERRSRACLLVCLVASALTGPSALAQEGRREQARVLHTEGSVALERDDFARARDRFRASLAAYPTRGTAFNLGLALRGAGQPLEAIEIWERLEAGSLGELEHGMADAVRGNLLEVRAQVARLELELAAPEHVQIAIDGTNRGTLVLESPRTFQLNPGPRVVTANASGFETLVRSVRLSHGSRESLRLTLTALPEPELDRSLFEHPLFWTTLGVIALGGIAVAIFFLTGPHYEDFTSTETFGVVDALRER